MAEKWIVSGKWYREWRSDDAISPSGMISPGFVTGHYFEEIREIDCHPAQYLDEKREPQLDLIYFAIQKPGVSDG